MRTFREAMVGFSVIPTVPILWIGGVIAFDGFWGVLKGDPIQTMQFLMWLLGLCGSIGLVIASLEKTYFSLYRKRLAVSLIVCGFLAIVISIYYAYYDLSNRYVPGFGLIEGDRSSGDKVLYALFVIWLLLLWPIFSGIMGIRNLLKK